MSVETKRDQEFDWRNCPPYMQFMNEVGGPNVVIPEEYTPSLRLRIIHRELTHLLHIGPRVRQDTALLIREVDTATGFTKSVVQKYEKGNPPEGQEYASIFFRTNSLKGRHNENVHSQIVKEVETISSDIQEALQARYGFILIGKLLTTASRGEMYRDEMHKVIEKEADKFFKKTKTQPQK